MPRNRRYFGPSFKRQVVLEILTGETTLAALARRYEVSSHLLIQWRQAYQTGRLADQPPPRDLHALAREATANSNDLSASRLWRSSS